jgi:hypothetical protein
MSKKIICISGKMRNGKNTLADLLKEELLTINPNTLLVICAFADELKKYCSEDFELLGNYLNNFSENLKTSINMYNDLLDLNPSRKFANQNINKMIDSLKLYKENFYENKTEISRLLLQIVGTNFARNRIDKDYWAKKLKDNILKSNNEYTLITDCRFPIELEIFSNLNDYELVTIRLERNLPTNNNQHESETALDNWTSWNYVVDNNGTTEDLKNSAKNIINDLINNT